MRLMSLFVSFSHGKDPDAELPRKANRLPFQQSVSLVEYIFQLLSFLWSRCLLLVKHLCKALKCEDPHREEDFAFFARNNLVHLWV
jgi:hypothetical protein